MYKIFVITNGLSGGFATLKFNDREAVLIFEDEALANKMMQGLPGGVVLHLEAESREKVMADFQKILSDEGRSDIEILFPDADEYWPLVKQFQQ